MITPATQLQHGSFKNIQLSPWHMVRRDNLAYVAGGISNPSVLPDFARHHRGGRIADTDIDTASNGAQLHGCYVWGGCYHEHFGHFIAEFVHRLWVCNLPENSGKTVLFTAHNTDYQLKPFFTDLMGLLGVENWLILTEPTTVEELTIGEQGKHLNAPPLTGYFPYLETLAAKLPSEDTHFPKFVAIMRGHMPNARLALESAIEKHLEEQGYTLFRPEDYSLQQQLQTLLNAEKIIISEGSALHLFDLLPKLKAEVAVINRRPNNILALSTLKEKVEKLAIFDQSYVAYVPTTAHGKDPNKALSFAPIGEVLTFLADKKFIADPIQENTAGYQADFENFIKKNTDNSTEPTGDSLTELLLSELARRVKQNRNLDIENTYLKAKAAINSADITAAEPHVRHYLWLNPNSQTAHKLQKSLLSLKQNTALP